MSRIAIDARELLDRPTGAGRYLNQLLAAWGALASAAPHEFILCAPAGARLVPPPGLRATVRTAPGRGTWWEQRRLPGVVAAARADVLFSPAYSAPLASRVPSVVAMHDVSFASHPEWFPAREGLRRRVLARLSARRARRVLTISAFSKREIVRHLGIDPARVEVVYPGTTAVAPARAADGRREPLVLYVGSIFSRRHVPALIDGFALAASHVPGARLDLVGDNRTSPRVDLARHAAASGAAVRVRSYVPDAELADLYGRAAVFAFLSEYEGFGLTPLEALAAGVPIVVLDTEVAREVYGEAAIYVARPDPPLVAHALVQALADAAVRARVLAAAPAVLARYSWERCARRTLEILQSAAEGG